MILWQLLPLCLLVHAQVQPSKVPLYIGSMAPLSGKRAWWGAGITAAMQMAFEYINNSSHILPSYELRLLANDTKVRMILIAILTFVTTAYYSGVTISELLTVMVLGLSGVQLGDTKLYYQ